MTEQELPPIRITDDDIREANQLSMHCPMCANPVENYVTDPDITPVVCTQCGTLYHKVCWEQNGGKCAVLGCGNEKYRIHGQDTRPTLTISYKDIPRVPPNGSSPSRRTQQLKNEQRRQVEQLRRPSLLRRLFQWLLDQIKIG
ncbi:MAG: hypothetical protein DWQ04_18635 [Chloroflexi bacterium]|nr:MAG: hypothetical protein DWQ04_18635 [Chloroflexota bacterium]